MTNLTRRSLLGKTAAAATIAAATAAVVALPAATQAFTPKRPGLSTWRDPEIAARLRDLEHKFKATLTPEQATMWREISDLDTDQLVAEQVRFVAALGEHIPGLATAIEIVAFGHGDIISGRCCEVRWI